MRSESTGNAGYNFDADHAQLWAIIKECRIAMLTTVEVGGLLRARPMTTVQKEFGGTLWFFSPTDSDAVHAVRENEQVCVAYANPDKADFVSLSGLGAVVTETAIKEVLWNSMVQTWFPQGPSSSEVAIIKIDVTRAEYWNSRSNNLVQLFAVAEAAVRGDTPKRVGEHREVRM
jgi:general stress protein 26